MEELLTFRDFCSDDYETFMGLEVDDHPRIAELNGKLDDDDVTFVIIATDYSLYIPVYPLVTNDPDGEIICEFIRTTSSAQQGRCYKGVSYAQLLNWNNIISEHMTNIGFERVDYKE